MRRIGVLGGTFDPIHRGHLVVAHELIDRLRLTSLVLVPSGVPWHKEQPLASGADRLAMVELAIAGEPRLAVSDVDIARGGTTYTIDTLGDLQRDAGDDTDWWFITGADALADFGSWRDPAGILARAKVVGVSRPGYVLQAPHGFEDAIEIVELPSLDIASSDIRRRVAAGESLAGLVPDAVADYIATHRMYASARPSRADAL